MATYYIDFNGGNDSNDGLSFANRRKSLPIEIVQDNQPIEMSIKKLKSSTVIAAVSTSLVNLKLKFGEDLKCYYFGLDDYVSPDYTKYYNKIFKQLKINNLIQNNV